MHKTLRYSPLEVKSLIRGSFNKGLGSVITLPGGYYRFCRISPKSDSRSIGSYWRMTGNQLRKSLKDINADSLYGK